VKTRNHVLILTNVLLIMEDVHNCVSMNLEVTNVNVKKGFIQQILSEYCTLEIFLLVDMMEPILDDPAKK
jgi:hypothetical protein